MTPKEPRPALRCAFLGADIDAARACGELRQAGIPAEMVEGAGNTATGALGDGYPAPLGGSWLAAVMVAAADQERAAEVLADFACGRPLDPLDFGRPLAAAAGRFTEAEHCLLTDLVAEVAAIYGDRLQALKLVGSRARGEARADSDWDFLVFLDACEHDVEGPRMAELAATLEQRHGCAPLSLSPLSREQFLGLDAKFEGIVERFRCEALDLGPVAHPYRDLVE